LPQFVRLFGELVGVIERGARVLVGFRFTESAMVLTVLSSRDARSVRPALRSRSVCSASRFGAELPGSRFEWPVPADLWSADQNRNATAFPKPDFFTFTGKSCRDDIAVRRSVHCRCRPAFSVPIESERRIYFFDAFS
jgi:hypothetical protein